MHPCLSVVLFQKIRANPSQSASSAHPFFVGKNGRFPRTHHASNLLTPPDPRNHYLAPHPQSDTTGRMDTIRTFIALHLPAAVEQTLLDTISQFRLRFPAASVRWVRQEQLHLTLRFLGETAVSHLPALQQGLDHIATRHAPLTLRLGSLGCFPNCQRPRVFWVGLEGELERLHALQQEIEGLVNQSGWAREKRPFSPHLTLGRSKDARHLQGTIWHGTPTSGEKQMLLTKVALVESQLRPDGAVYTIRHVSRLTL